MQDVVFYARATGLEPATFCVTGRRSNQTELRPQISPKNMSEAKCDWLAKFSVPSEVEGLCPSTLLRALIFIPKLKSLDKNRVTGVGVEPTT